MQVKAKINKTNVQNRKRIKTKQEKIDQLVKEIGENRREFSDLKFFKGTADEVIAHLKKIKDENNNLSQI